MTALELKVKRKQLGLTQVQFGDMVGYSRQQVINWEKNEYSVPKIIALVVNLMLK